MNAKGILLVISGFSGVGKGTLVKYLLSNYEDYAISVSATTRNPREGEIDGREYYFLKKEEFQKMIEADDLFEYAQYCDNYYGTPKKYVEQQLEKGKNVILEIEIQGALNIKRKFPEAVLMFILPPSADTLKERLIGRQTESEEVVLQRLKRAGEEAEGIEEYDYVFVNDQLEVCAQQIHQLVCAQKYRADRNLAFIEQIKQEVKEFSKGE